MNDDDGETSYLSENGRAISYSSEDSRSFAFFLK